MRKTAFTALLFLLTAAAFSQTIDPGFYGTWRTDGTHQVITIGPGKEKGTFIVTAEADGEAFSVTAVSGSGTELTATFTYMPNDWTTTSHFTLVEKNHIHEEYSGASSGELEWTRDAGTDNQSRQKQKKKNN